MDFFEAQDRARKRTTRLVLLFGLAVLGTILASYGAAIVITLNVGEPEQRHAASPGLTAVEGIPDRHTGRYWRPDIFVPVSLVTIAIVGFGSLFKWFQFRAGGSAVAESVGARRVEPGTTDPAERRLLNVVEEMAIASGVPVPAVYILDQEPAINAFAAGLTSHDAVVAVTRGTLEKLSRDELQGVVGHEFSHILNGDMRLNVRLSAILFGILLIGLIGRTILRGLGRVRLRSSGDRKGGGTIAGLFAVGLAFMIVGYVGYFFGRLIQAAVSRQREFLADASAVQFTRNPGGLTGALKKIGGYALGSTIVSDQAAAIGHFFFAQGFRSMFDGMWATHPPLPERIRAIEPHFSGEMFDPPQVVDVARESFVSAGLAPARPATPPRLAPSTAINAVAQVGTLTSEQIANAQLLLASVPAGLREAARVTATAPALVYGLLLADDPALRARQRELVAARAGTEAASNLDRLEPALRATGPEHRLPLLHLSLPVLRGLPPDALAAFLDTLDELVHADACVSPFEFALQKLLTHALALGQAPHAPIVQYQSFHAVADEIAVILSALAHASTTDANSATQAFAAGTRQLSLITARLQFLPTTAASMEKLDAALDKLALASGPIKQRTLVAAAHTVGSDGQILITEAELLRAIAAALDCPMPALTA
jgi:Zn-dependent protease with chaperone function